MAGVGVMSVLLYSQAQNDVFCYLKLKRRYPPLKIKVLHNTSIITYSKGSFKWWTNCMPCFHHYYAKLDHYYAFDDDLRCFNWITTLQSHRHDWDLLA